MNERIQELAINCAGQIEWDFPADPESFTFNCDELKKFAELIVRECLATCSKQAADWEGDYANAHNDGVGSCIGGIKEHFGVEE